MRELPFLPKPVEISAILAGKQVQFRQIIKPQPEYFLNCVFGKPVVSTDGRFYTVGKDGKDKTIISPYQVGDMVYIKETFRDYTDTDDVYKTIIEYAADGGHISLNQCDGDGFQMFNKDGSEKMVPWIASAVMPKSVARIWLKITNVRVELIQNIDDIGAMDAGIMNLSHEWVLRNFPGYEMKHTEWSRDQTTGTKPPLGPTPSRVFEKLWQQMHGDSWNRNDWVWVYNFNIISTIGKL